MHRIRQSPRVDSRAIVDASVRGQCFHAARSRGRTFDGNEVQVLRARVIGAVDHGAHGATVGHFVLGARSVTTTCARRVRARGSVVDAWMDARKALAWVRVRMHRGRGGDAMRVDATRRRVGIRECVRVVCACGVPLLDIFLGRASAKEGTDVRCA